MDTKGLDRFEAQVMGSMNVLGYCVIKDLVKASELPSAMVVKSVSSLIARGILATDGPWYDTSTPYYITTINDGRPIREVFHSVNRLDEMLRREAGVNSDLGVSDAIYTLTNIVSERQRRDFINIANNWKPAISVNNMILVSEFSASSAKNIMEVLKKDRELDSIGVVGPVISKGNADTQFGATFLRLNALDTALRKDADVNSDYGLSGAVYDLKDIVESRQARLKDTGTDNRRPNRKIIVSEINRYSSLQEIRSIEKEDCSIVA